MITHSAYCSRCTLSQQQGKLGDNSVCIQNLEKPQELAAQLPLGSEGECGAKKGGVC